MEEGGKGKGNHKWEGGKNKPHGIEADGKARQRENCGKGEQVGRWSSVQRTGRRVE